MKDATLAAAASEATIALSMCTEGDTLPDDVPEAAPEAAPEGVLEGVLLEGACMAEAGDGEPTVSPSLPLLDVIRSTSSGSVVV
jgi:hypothetical protein